MKEIALHFLLSYWELPLSIRKVFLPLFRGMISLFAKQSIFSELIEIDKECEHHGQQPSAALRKDIIAAWILFGATPKEYFLYDFANKSDKERDTYLTDHLRIQLLKREIGIQYFRNELINKYGFYLRNKKYFRRECLRISSSITFEEFQAYVKRVGGKTFVKDNNGSYGSEGRAISDESVEKLRNEYEQLIISQHEWIAEGFILQDKRLACWNETSVNTIRIPSFLTAGGTQILGPFIRTGRVGACVDNADSGGIFAVIDEKTGKIVTDGADKFGNVFSQHPDSKIVYKGWQVPMWDELLAIASEAHRQMPEHKYIGYDFALSPDGWIMVEGNWGQYIAQQISMRRGQKREFYQLLCGK